MRPTESGGTLNGRCDSTCPASVSGRLPRSRENPAVIRSALFSLALAAPLAAQPALSAPVDARVSYVLTVGGINVALVDVDFDDDGQRYDFDLSARVTGLGNVVASGTAKASVSGASTASGLQADRFQLETRANGEVFNVDVGFAGRNVTSFQVTPPVLDNYDRVPLERSHLNGVADFLSSFVLKGNGLDKSLCQREFKIFTGVERFNIAMSYLADDEATSPRTGYQGPLVTCAVKYRPISGHFESSEMTQYMAETSRIILWYAPLGASGYYVPYRLIIGTSMGDLSMVLTNARAE